MLYAFALPGFQTFSYAAQLTFVMGGRGTSRLEGTRVAGSRIHHQPL